MRPGSLAPTAFLLAALGVAACAGNPPAPSELRPGWSETGEASWYGPGFHGRPTASGEKFDMDAATAAHRWLPFGTVLGVENLSNGRQTRVRVNDRGPFARDRILDLSRAAGRELGMLSTGVAPVRIVILEVPDPECRELQVGAFRDRDNAVGLLRRLEEAGVRARREATSGGLIRVVAGPFHRSSRLRAVRERWGGTVSACSAP